MGEQQLEAARTLGFEVRNSQRFAHNMARLVEEAGKAATVLLRPHATDPTHITLHDDFAPALRTFAQLQRAWLRQPYKAFKAQVALWNSCFDLWHSSVCRDTVGEWVRRRVESGVGAVISGGFAMSLHPQQPIPSVPEQTARIARAAFPKGSPYLTLRDTLGTIFEDGHFA